MALRRFGNPRNLLRVRHRFARSEWATFVDDLLEHCLVKASTYEWIGDAALCHGTTGIAHVFNRIYQATGDTQCLAAALSWIDRTLAALDDESRSVNSLSLISPDYSFLSGITGIALGLLAAIAEAPPAWDRLLLLSGRDVC